ncbi:MAG: ABC transporter substrate-binding protein [Bradyrhizobium sp.]|nr:ABC transporter substrate-binding protein [Bradyrhizobium sp.]
MKRRAFITLLGGAAAWPLATRAQRRDRVRGIGVLMAWSEGDADGASYLEAFHRELTRLGWSDGGNARIDQRWTGNFDSIRMYADELVRLQPDVIVAITTAAVLALQKETRTIPIVFASVGDPVGLGLVASLARPGANITGFAHAEGEIAGKWLELIKESAPDLRRAAIMFNPDFQPAQYTLGTTFQAAAKALSVEPIMAPVRNDAEIEAAIEALGRERGGLVVATDAFLSAHRENIIANADRSRVPAISNDVHFVKQGGLFVYVERYVDMFRGAAGYVDRILKGEKASDLPIQLPTKYEFQINLRTAKALDLTVPPILQATADEVME